jgi:hypothetical protein
VAPHNAYRADSGGIMTGASSPATLTRNGSLWCRLWECRPGPLTIGSATVAGQLQHQGELDEQIEVWTRTLGKDAVTEQC